MTRKALIVVNPAVGRDILTSFQEAVGRHFRAAGIVWEIHETQPGDTPDTVARVQAAGGYDLVVAAGGDGTVSAACEGLAGGDIPLGIVPLGTGNLVARELDIPHDVDGALAVIAGTPATRRIDAMRVNGRICLISVSVGISASVVSDTTRREKKLFGRLAYFGTAILKVLDHKPRRLMVAVDGEARKYRAVEVSVMNCGVLARMLNLQHEGILVDDGRLDVWILRVRTLFDYPRYALELLTRRATHPQACFLTADKRIVIHSRRPQPVQADGDIIGTTPVEIELLPRAIPILVPNPES